MAPTGVDGASSIQVIVRVRPFTIREAAQLTRQEDAPLFLGDGSLAGVPQAPRAGAKGLRSVIKVMDEKCLVFDPPDDNPVQRFSRAISFGGKSRKDQTFGFDRVFDENTTQGDVYEATTKNLLDSVLDGYNATVFAYGATGCGKTHTITGTAQEPGIIFMTMQELFEKVGEVQEEKECDVTLSYLEIYNETIRDLLSPGAGGKQGLMLREDSHQAVSVAGLTSHKPQNVEEVMDMVIRGNAARTQSPTEANATSSRSHAVLQVNVSLKDRNASTTEPVTFATLSIIDLAGSERASATKNRGERLLEGANINKSLLALGSCINALCDPRKKNHVPYRNSKLTRLLKFSLGGNCRTVMIVCVSPSSQHFDETQNTLRYANRAKNIQTKSVRNVYSVDRHVKDYLKKIDEQMNRITELQNQQKQYEELALAKFRKAEAKRAEVAQEGVARIRAAYDHSSGERKDRLNQMKRLRQTERRISAISGWIGAFDQVCETREDEDAPPALMSMRKTAQGILVELEGSRQHFHQRLARNNWTRAIDTALQDGLRQLQGLESAAAGGPEEQKLHQEVELLKGRADMEAHAAVLEQEKATEGGLMRVLLSANFETVAILSQIMQMGEEDAVQAAKQVLGKLLVSCTEAAGQVIKPDGGLQITEAVPPTRSGTPRKRKQVPIMGPSPLKTKLRPSPLGAAPTALPIHVTQEMHPALSSSPARALQSPRRRVKLGGARRGVAFAGTPRKKSPAKKRAVRWRDDTDDGALVEFQPTPKPLDNTPEDVSGPESLAPPTLTANVGGSQDSSPIPGPPVFSSELRRAATGRFAAGFLAKKNESSPNLHPPALSLMSSGSEDDSSPLREMAANSAPRANGTSAAAPRTVGNKCSATGSDVENETAGSVSSGPDTDTDRPTFPRSKEELQSLRTAMRSRRNSTLGSTASASHPHRRRSPNGASTSPSQQEGIFSASHARRMIKGGDRSDVGTNVLSPRTAPVTKGPSHMRRSMFESGMSGHRESAVGARGHSRQSSITPGSATSAGSKAAWR